MLSGRPELLAIIVGIVFVGAFLRELILGERGARARRHAAAGVARAPPHAAQAGGAGPARLRDRVADHVLPQPLPARSRHHDPDLCDAGLGPEHRRRPRRPARSRLRRLLRGRRLFLRAAGGALRLLVLDLPAARRHPRLVLGHHPRLSGAAAARRLSRHRHHGVRRDHPAGAAQLAERSPTAPTASAASRGRASSACRSPAATTASRTSSGWSTRSRTASSFSIT